MRVLSLLSASLIVVGAAACAGDGPATDTAPSVGPTAVPHASLAQLMRGVPFPNSNIIFDTQDLDPEATGDEDAGGAGATNLYGDLYGGWEGVENASLAIAETGWLLMVPGRLCENGLPVPNDREDFQRFAQGLVEAGLESYRVAQTQDLDAMLEVGGVVSDACFFCHEVYRDVPEGAMRCVPPAE